MSLLQPDMEFCLDLVCQRKSSLYVLVTKKYTEFGRLLPLDEDDVDEEEDDETRLSSKGCRILIRISYRPGFLLYATCNKKTEPYGFLPRIHMHIASESHFHGL